MERERASRRAAGRGIACVVWLALASAAPASAADRPELTAAISSVGAASAPTAQTVPLGVEVTNSGAANSPQTSVRFYRSTDSKITSSDTLVTTERLRPVTAGYDRSVTGQVKVGTTPGKFWFGACVVAVPNEVDASNQCTSGAPIEVGKRPEVVAADLVVDPATVRPGDTLHVTATVRNDGTGTAAPGYANLVWSADPTIDPGDDGFAGVDTPSLAPGAAFTVVLDARERFGAGTSWYGVCASTALFESSTANNCTAGVPVTVEGPDLAVLAPAIDQPRVELGESVTLTVEVRNVGTEASATTGIEFEYQGATRGGSFGELAVPALPPGGSQTFSMPRTQDEPGATDVWACVDRVADELLGNDCSTPLTFQVSGVELADDQDWIRVGERNYVWGSGFTAGTVVMMYVAGASGVTTYGPIVPESVDNSSLFFTPPLSVSLGNGFASMVAINTDQGYATSSPACVNLLGPFSGNPPSIEEIDDVPLADPDCSVPFSFIPTALAPGAPFVVGGHGFDQPRASLFTGAGNLGPLDAALGWLTYSATFTTPVSAPIGPAAVQVVSAPYAGNAASNAVLVVVGEAIGIEAVSVNGATVTVTGRGFAPGAVINLFNAQGGSVVNLGGLDSGGAPLVPLTAVTPTSFQFQRPSGAVTGKAFVEVLNPPFIPVTSTGNDPDGAFDLP